MKVTSKKLPKSQIELTIELEAKELTPFIKKAVTSISETTKIDGFRPGHVTYDVLKQKVGEMAILQEAANHAISKTLYEAAKQENLFLVNQPSISIEKLAPDNNFIYKAICTVLPEVKIPELDKVKKTIAQKVEVKDEDVQNALKEISRMHQKEALKKEPAEKGDKIEVDFDIFQNNVLIENGSYKKYPVTIGENIMIPGFEDALIGLKADDTKEFELTFSKEYHQKAIAGKKSTFKVKVLNVYKIEQPEMNDEFAKTLGKFKTLGELKQQLRENLTMESQNREDQRFEQEILKNVVAESAFTDIPETLIESEQDRILEDVKHQISHYDLNWDDYLSHMKKTEDDIKAGYKNQAIERIKSALIIREISLNHKITASAEEIDKELSELKERYKSNESVSKHLNSGEYRKNIETAQVNKKVMELLKEKVGETVKG